MKDVPSFSSPMPFIGHIHQSLSAIFPLVCFLCHEDLCTFLVLCLLHRPSVHLYHPAFFSGSLLCLVFFNFIQSRSPLCFLFCIIIPSYSFRLHITFQPLPLIVIFPVYCDPSCCHASTACFISPACGSCSICVLLSRVEWEGREGRGTQAPLSSFHCSRCMVCWHSCLLLQG